MKTSKIFVILLLICSAKLVYSQCDSGELSQLLNSNDPYDRFEAAIHIAEFEFEELIPDLETRFYEEEYLYVAQMIIFALDSLHSIHLEQTTLDFIENADNLQPLLSFDDPLKSKVYGCSILFELQNYSAIDFVFDEVEIERPNLDLTVIFCLLNILTDNNLSQYQSDAKNELIDFVNTNADDVVRSVVLEALVDRFGSELTSLLLDKSNNDPDWIVRDCANEMLAEINYTGLRTEYYQKLQNDIEPQVRRILADSILSLLGEPQDLKEVIDHIDNEGDEDMQIIMQYKVDKFIPPRPTVSTSEMISNLITYTKEIFKYGWIGDDETYQDYKSLLVGLKENYANSDLEGICKNIDTILENTEFQHNTSSLTEEGYKFLHYHSVYIKENIESEFGSCEN